jgi:hypothetical protein
VSEWPWITAWQTRTKRQSEVVAPSNGKKPASMPKRQMPHDLRREAKKE